MTTKKDVPKKAGQPTKYLQSYNPLAYKICKETGATDKQLAEILSVSKATITNWKRDYPDFLASIKRGKDIYDCSNVEKSLLKRALGYDYEETTVEVSEVDGVKRKIQKVIKKHVAPDVTACFGWLQNRNKDRWKNVKYIDPAGGGDNENWGDIMKGFGEAIQGKFVDKPG